MAPMPTPQADLEARAEPAWASPRAASEPTRNSARLGAPPPAGAGLGDGARARGARLDGARRRRPVRRLSYTPGASEDPLAPDETPQSALEVVVPDSMV